MESPKKIAHEIGEIGGVKRDDVRFGLNGVKSDIVGSHLFIYSSSNLHPRLEFSFQLIYVMLSERVSVFSSMPFKRDL